MRAAIQSVNYILSIVFENLIYHCTFCSIMKGSAKADNNLTTFCPDTSTVNPLILDRACPAKMFIILASVVNFPEKISFGNFRKFSGKFPEISGNFRKNSCM